MKKPKTRLKHRAKEMPPKESLIIDYGLTRVILPYSHSIDLYNNAELDIICEWCAKTFPQDGWRCVRSSWPGYLYFLEESYIIVFLLRWSK